jgi:hypothetical protein
VSQDKIYLSLKGRSFYVRKVITTFAVTDSATLPIDQRTMAELLLFIDQYK